MENILVQPQDTKPAPRESIPPVIQPTPKPSYFKFFISSLALILFGVLIGVVAARFFPSSQPEVPVITPTSTPTPSLNINPEWETYTDPEAKYEIQYPPIATLSRAKTVPSVEIVYIGPHQPKTESALSNGYKIIISYEFTAPTQTVSSAANYVHQHAIENCPSPKEAVVSSLINTSLSGEPAIQFSVENCYGDDTRYFVIKGDKLFTITAVYLAESIDQRMHFKEQAYDIIATFKFSESIGVITNKQLLSGWYWGSQDQKLSGTPDTWVFLEAGRSSCWHKPEVSCITVQQQI